MRKGAAKGTGSGYKNLPGFPRDPRVHDQSRMGIKQPQKTPYTISVSFPVEVKGSQQYKTSIAMSELYASSPYLSKKQKDKYIQETVKKIGGDIVKPKSVDSFGREHYYPTQYGFDLTDFHSDEDFIKVLKENDLPLTATELKRDYADGKRYYLVFEFKNKDLVLHTGHNPITGKWNADYDQDRTPEKGYAAYMGVEGKPESVKKLVSSIKRHAQEIKGEDKKELQFIW